MRPCRSQAGEREREGGSFGGNKRASLGNHSGDFRPCDLPACAVNVPACPFVVLLCGKQQQKCRSTRPPRVREKCLQSSPSDISCPYDAYINHTQATHTLSTHQKAGNNADDATGPLPRPAEGVESKQKKGVAPALARVRRLMETDHTATPYALHGCCCCVCTGVSLLPGGVLFCVRWCLP